PRPRRRKPGRREKAHLGPPQWRPSRRQSLSVSSVEKIANLRRRLTAPVSSALFDGRSAAVDSDAVGTAASAGLTGTTARSGRVSTLAVAGGPAGTTGGAGACTTL